MIHVPGTYIDYALALCQSWPNISEPATPEQAVTAHEWYQAIKVSPCRWVMTPEGIEKFKADTEPSMAGTSVPIRINHGQMKSKAAREQLPYYICVTHGTKAERLYLREFSWYMNVQNRLTKWWEFKHEPQITPSGYKTLKLVAKRKFLIDTMRKMW